MLGTEPSAEERASGVFTIGQGRNAVGQWVCPAAGMGMGREGGWVGCTCLGGKVGAWRGQRRGVF